MFCVMLGQSVTHCMQLSGNNRFLFAFKLCLSLCCIFYTNIVNNFEDCLHICFMICNTHPTQSIIFVIGGTLVIENLRYLYKYIF